jgi:hypothetical protein
MKGFFLATVIALLFLVGLRPVRGQSDQTYLGLVALKSNYDNGKYLQTHGDGELHASNTHHDTEETWKLYLVDAEKGYFRLQNFDNSKYLRIKNPTPPPPGPDFGGVHAVVAANNCPQANVPAPGEEETLVFRRGAPNTVNMGKITMSSKTQGRFLTANAEGDDTHCGGEVAADGNQASMDRTWNGWWTLEAVSEPNPDGGRSIFTVFNDVGGVVADFAKAIAESLSHIHIQ